MPDPHPWVVILARNTRLRFAVECLLREANPHGKKFFKVTHFYKMLFLLHMGLKERGVDLKPPYCWYKRGPMLVREEFVRDVGVPLSTYVDKDSTKRITHVSCEGVSREDQYVIQSEVSEIVEKYKEGNYFRDGYIKELLHDAYEYAPHDFQRVFSRMFFPAIEHFKPDDKQTRLFPPALSDYERTNIEKLLDKLVALYPEDEMGELYDTFLEWEDTFRLSLIHEPSKVYGLADDFWEIFCKLLRIRHNENISEKTLDWWVRSFQNDLSEYEGKLERERERLLEIHIREIPPSEGVLKIADGMMAVAYDLAMQKKER